MASISKSALVGHSASDMYQLVDDIEAYPEFLPWCRSATVHSRDEDEVRASIEISHGALHKSFTTCNRLQRDKMIEMQLVEGPFRHLHGFWRFSSLGEAACKVSFDLEFEFSSRVVAMVAEPIFGQITSSLVDAFCRRADKLYGGRI